MIVRTGKSIRGDFSEWPTIYAKCLEYATGAESPIETGTRETKLVAVLCLIFF